jgi:hypothetical protein
MRAEERVLRAVEPRKLSLQSMSSRAYACGANRTGLIAVPNTDELWKRSGSWTRRPDLIV